MANIRSRQSLSHTPEDIATSIAEAIDEFDATLIA